MQIPERAMFLSGVQNEKDVKLLSECKEASGMVKHTKKVVTDY
jgi:hypothetical protein